MSRMRVPFQVIPSNAEEVITESDPKDVYKRQSGTSMAAPYVSGAAALVWLADPELTGAQVKEILCDTADIPLENCSSWKLLDAAKACLLYTSYRGKLPHY